MTEPTYRLDRWQQDLADELARAERPPVTVADLRRMMGLPPAEETIQRAVVDRLLDERLTITQSAHAADIASVKR